MKLESKLAASRVLGLIKIAHKHTICLTYINLLRVYEEKEREKKRGKIRNKKKKILNSFVIFTSKPNPSHKENSRKTNSMHHRKILFLY